MAPSLLLLKSEEEKNQNNGTRRLEMKDKCPEGDFGFFSAHLDGEVLHIRFRENLLEHLANLYKRDVVAKFSSQVLKSRDVKVILLNSDFQEAGCEAYTRFFLKGSQAGSSLDLHRLCNITSQLVLSIIDMDRIVIHACKGNVISLFLNVSLACDYRIAADNTMFCNPYIDLGMMPIGGGPYLLSKIMGTGKAWETLLLRKDINALNALELGLVDRVVPSENLDIEAINIASKFASNHSGTISGIKKLMNFSKKDLKEYFETEQHEIFKILNSSDFSGRHHDPCC